MTSKQVRQQFLDFFAAKGHVIVDSSPVVPLDDPTLMFTNAGMNQFKDVFLGTGSRPYTRVADTQKCIRAGGKHNDLDDVGQDAYHHTFFEMLGNWSFGDYFKKEAIEWAWELLTEVWGIEKARLHATYFEGDASEGLEPDTEAAELWKSVTDIDPTHVHPGGKKDNFWEMGDAGPCGPCSEIHIDLTPDKSGISLVNAGDPRVIELWNLVFIQFNRAPGGKLTPLPAKHVDTGMGFERLCAVLNGKDSNYDTDVWTPIFDAIQKRTGAPSYQGTLPSEQSRDRNQNVETSKRRNVETSHPSRDRNQNVKTSKRRNVETSHPSRDREGADVGSAVRTTSEQVMIDVSYRVIADHVRCLTFALTDGAFPSNEGRGYVLRRILRRAVRYGRQYMNMQEPFLCDLVEPVVEHMGDAFPELRTAHAGKNVEHVTELIRDEEASFLSTLDRGIDLFEQAAFLATVTLTAHSSEARKLVDANAAAKGMTLTDVKPSEYYAATDWRSVPEHLRPVISGEDAFRLHDTYGFPVDLTELMAQERGLTVNIGEYERLMEEARAKARVSAKQLAADILMPTSHETADSFKYAQLEIEAHLIFWNTTRGSADPSRFDLHEGDKASLFLDITCFYGEQGGQVGDIGVIEGDGWTFRVTDTFCGERTVAHVGVLEKGRIPFTPGDKQARKVMARVDGAQRVSTMKNHTSTHMLNWALREVLGDHIQQKGSLVDPEKTRFDFSHNKPLTDEQLGRIEDLVNERIEADQPVYTKEVEEKKAREINTLRAVFGEKYPEPVRVVSIGAPIGEKDVEDPDTLLGNPTDPKWMKYPVEFCGGTHLKRSGEAERFMITTEEAVAKGIRRVVGITGEAARQAMDHGNELLAEALALADQPPVAPSAEQPPVAPGAVGSAVRTTTAQDASEKGPQGGPYTFADRVAALQQKVNEATIPVCVRAELRERIAELQKLARKQEKQAAASSGDAVMDRVRELTSTAETIDGVTVIVGEVPAAPVEALRRAIDWVRNKKGASAVLLAMVSDNKVTLVAGMSKDVVKRGVRAGDLIKEVAPFVGGKGGGRPDMAQGGGGDPTGVPNVIDCAKAWIGERLS